MINSIMYVVLILVIIILVVITIVVKGSKHGKSVDDMEGHDFEVYCAELLKESGFYNVAVTKGSGDYGVDILAEKDMITYAIQCKVYSEPVGVKAVQEVYAGRDFYDRMVGVVLTNQYFTENARKAAEKLKILLWDRDYLEELEENLQEQ